jgi:YD repeat-containing protein
MKNMRRTLILTGGLWLAGALFADAVTYTYDDAGRLSSATYPNGAAITYTYDAAGNLTARTVTGAAGSSAPKPVARRKKKSPAHSRGAGIQPAGIFVTGC